jgi:hypothetical protein
VSKFFPDHRYPSLADVPIEEWALKGVRGVLLDIDNTLVPYGNYSEVPESNRQWLERAGKLGVKCILYSNASQHKIEKIKEVSGLSGVPKVYKPANRLLPKALGMLGCRKDEIVLIGDQICTDILGGNLGGITTILVEPMSSRDWIGTKLLRMIEWLVLPDRRPWLK